MRGGLGRIFSCQAWEKRFPHKMNVKHNERVLDFLRIKSQEGATITEIVTFLHLTRDNVRIAVAALEGAGKILVRAVGKAKLYRVKR